MERNIDGEQQSPDTMLAIRKAVKAAIIAALLSVSLSGCPEGGSTGKKIEPAGGIEKTGQIMRIQDQSRAKIGRGPRIINLETMEDKPYGLVCEI